MIATDAPAPETPPGIDTAPTPCAQVGESPAQSPQFNQYSLAGVHDVPRGALVHALVVVDDVAP